MPLSKCTPIQKKLMLNFMLENKQLVSEKLCNGSDYKREMVSEIY